MRTRGTSTAIVAGALALALIGAACSKSSGSGSSSSASSGGGTGVTGAGSTFAQPVYDQWIQDFQGVQSGAQINYQGIGSGGGVQQFTAKTVDFGGTDAPLQSSEESALPAPAIEIPTMLGGVSVAYNVSGVQSGLKLDGTTVADIFLGKITTWNDPAIKALNPGVTLPGTTISTVHRSDESGTTFVFTSWLSTESADWKSQVGADKAVQWPVGQGGDGSDGVAAAISQTDGSIGYVAYDYAVKSNLGSAAVKAPDGAYVAPSVQSIGLAGGGLKLPITPDTNILNSNVKGAYPLSSTTYMLIYKAQTDQAKGQTLVDFAYWGLTKGSSSVTQLNYAPLPAKVSQQALAELATVTYNGTPIKPSSSAM
jgi:phosphate transport system substrate-binding protein